MIDPRISTLADRLVNYSISAQKGDKVLVEACDADSALVTEIVKKIYAVGAIPFVDLFDTKVKRALLMGADEKSIEAWARHARSKMDDMNCYIGIRGADNLFELSDVSDEVNDLYSRLYFYPVHDQIRVRRTRWVILRYPNDAMSQLSGMSTEKFEDFYFSVCNLDYSKMNKNMTKLQNLMNNTDKVRIIAKDTDISFSIKGIPAIKCAGELNIPDGEVYTAPVRDSVNGKITYNAPSIKNGVKFENVSLEFKDGKIISADGNYPELINSIFDTDDGARYVGEFAIGINPLITHAMGDILFDEKIAGLFILHPVVATTTLTTEILRRFIGTWFLYRLPSLVEEKFILTESLSERTDCLLFPNFCV